MRLLAFIWGQLVGFARAAGTDTNCVTSFSLSCQSTLDNLTRFACVKLRSDCNAIPRERGWPSDKQGADGLVHELAAAIRAGDGPHTGDLNLEAWLVTDVRVLLGNADSLQNNRIWATCIR